MILSSFSSFSKCAIVALVTLNLGGAPTRPWGGGSDSNLSVVSGAADECLVLRDEKIGAERRQGQQGNRQGEKPLHGFVPFNRFSVASRQRACLEDSVLPAGGWCQPTGDGLRQDDDHRADHQAR